jgi:DnaJ-class molecular chaperone
MHGDLILHIAIDIPQKVSGDEKKIYETLRDIHGGKQVQKGFWESILG